MKRDLKAIRGHADMATTFQEKGLAAMLATLSSLLPPLITPGLSFDLCLSARPSSLIAFGQTRSPMQWERGGRGGGLACNSL